MTTVAQSKSSLKPTNIGPAENTKCLMVRIDWTSAPVVHIKARQSFKMAVEQVSVLKGVYTTLKTLEINVSEGQEVYFAQSGRDGYYYINLVGETVSCTCVASLHFHKSCQHKTNVALFATFAAKLDTTHEVPAQDVEDTVPTEVQEHITSAVEALREQYNALHVEITPGMSREEKIAAWQALVSEQRRVKKQIKQATQKEVAA